MRRFVAVVAFLFSCFLVSCTDDLQGFQPGPAGSTHSTAETGLHAPPKYAIRRGTFYGLSAGTELAEVSDRLESGALDTPDGPLPVYFIRGRDAERIGYLLPSVKDATQVGNIHITTPTAATEGDIRVGHNFARLWVAYPKLQVRGSEEPGKTCAYSTNKAFCLQDFTSAEPVVEPSRVPSDTRVSEIVLLDPAAAPPMKL